METCTHRCTLTETQSGYFVVRSELEDFLQQQFGDKYNFEIQHSNYRWKFKTPTPLDDSTVRNWIEELQARKYPRDDNLW